MFNSFINEFDADWEAIGNAQSTSNALSNIYSGYSVLNTWQNIIFSKPSRYLLRYVEFDNWYESLASVFPIKLVQRKIKKNSTDLQNVKKQYFHSV